jgi:hypothetical protein
MEFLILKLSGLVLSLSGIHRFSIVFLFFPAFAAPSGKTPGCIIGVDARKDA